MNTTNEVGISDKPMITMNVSNPFERFWMDSYSLAVYGMGWMLWSMRIPGTCVSATELANQLAPKGNPWLNLVLLNRMNSLSYGYLVVSGIVYVVMTDSPSRANT